MGEKNRNSGHIHVRCPVPLERALQKYSKLDTHMTASELVRAAVREKINQNAPEILREEIKKWKEEEEGGEGGEK